MMVLMVGTSFGGILLNGATAPQPCTSTHTSKGGVILSDATGILLNGFTGILLNGLTGILLNGVRGETPVECGILLGD
jgi:hypothetical protein